MEAINKVRLHGIAACFRLLALCILLFGAVATYVVGGDSMIESVPILPRKPLVVIYMSDMAPFSFVDENGKAQGMAIELLQLWAKRIGVSLEFKAANQREGNKIMQEGAGEIILPLYYSEDRNAYLDFADVIAPGEGRIFYDKNSVHVEGLDSLSGFKVGVIKGSIYVDFVKNNTKNAMIVLYENYSTLISSAQKKKFKVFIGDSTVLMHGLSARGLSEAFRTDTKTVVYRNNHWIAVRKNQPELLALLKQGMMRISNEDRAGLEKKWLDSASIKLGDTLFLSVPYDDPPYTFLNAERQAAGLYVDIWKLWGQKVGRNVEFVFSEWAESYRKVISGYADIHSGFPIATEYLAAMDESLAFYETSTSMFFPVNNRDNVLKQYRERRFAGLRMGALLYSYSATYLEKEKLGANLVKLDSRERLLRALLRGEIDACLSEQETMQQVIQRLGLDGRFDVLRQPVVTQKVYAGVKKGNTNMLALVNKGLLSITADEMHEIERRWIHKNRSLVWVIWAASGAAVVILLSLLWSFSLKMKVKERTAELADSESRYRKLFEGANEGICLLSPEGVVLKANEEYAKMHGYQTDEIISKSLKDLAAEKTFQLSGMRLKRMLEGDTLVFEAEHIRKNGSVFYVEIAACVITVGRERCVQCFCRNITERKLTEQALMRSEERFKKLFNKCSAVQLILCPETGAIIDANEAAAAFYGWSIDALVQKSIYSINTMNPLLLEDELKNTNKNRFEYCNRRADGSIRNVVVYRTTIEVEGKALLYSIVHDVTDRVTSMDAIRKLSVAVEQSPVSVVITDKTGNIEYVNPKFIQLTGYSLKEVVGCNPRFLKGSMTSAAEYAQLWQSISNGREWRGELHNRKKSGEYYWEYASISPILDSSGNITHYLAVKEDVTDKKALESQLQQAKKMESIGRFAEGIAHDFNNILAVIMTQLRNLGENESLDGMARILLQEISACNQRGTRLIKQLLMFGRKSVLECKVLDINMVAEDMMNMLERLIGDQAGLKLNRCKEVLAVNADIGMMEQVLTNLCTNARDAVIHNGGNIILTTSVVCVDNLGMDARSGCFACISVEDDGCGMDAATVERIYDPFYTTKAPGQGTGLGLATAHSIVTQHNGWIDVKSELGKGSVFKVYLPLTNKVPEEHPYEPVSTEFSGTETILYVEDEETIRRITSRDLRKIGYEVLEADSGITALSIWEQRLEEIDLVVTDMRMPVGLSGKDLVTRFRSEKNNVPVICASGSFVELSAYGEGVTLLMKPYSTEDLARLIRASFESKQGIQRK